MTDTNRLTDAELEEIASNLYPLHKVAMARELLAYRRAGVAINELPRSTYSCGTEWVRLEDIRSCLVTPPPASRADADHSVSREWAERNLHLDEGVTVGAGGRADADLREMIRAALEGELSVTAYDCTRVWEAWGVGTMTEDDFEPVTERLDEITDTVIAALSTPAPSRPDEGERT